MKKCPFCAEEIQDEAIKCRFCGEFLVAQKKMPWYFRTATLVAVFLTVGPLVLPLVIFHPVYSFKKKCVLSLATILLTLAVAKVCAVSLGQLKAYYQPIFDMMNGRPVSL